MGLFDAKKITDLEAANATLTGQLAQANAEKGQLQERLTTLEAFAENGPALEVARSEVGTPTANARVGAFEAAFPADGHFTFGADATKPVVALTDKGRAALINGGITAALAASGHAALPVAASVDTGTGAKADDKSPDAIRARAVASTNAQVSGFLAGYNTQK